MFKNRAVYVLLIFFLLISTSWAQAQILDQPAVFSKLGPTNGSIAQPVNPALTWSVSAGAISYSYCIDMETVNNNTCNSGWVDVGNTTTAFTFLFNGPTFYWQVKAINSEDEETLANNGTWWSLTTAETYPEVLSKLSPENGSIDVYKTTWLFWWDNSADGVTYEYCINTSASCPSEDAWVDEGDNTAAQVPASRNLLPDTLYYWQVRTSNETPAREANGGVWWSFRTNKAGPTSSNQTVSTCTEDLACSRTLNTTANYPKTVTLVGSPPSGNFVLNTDGSFNYNPPSNFQGSTSFQFVVSDGHNPPSSTYTATIPVQGQNDAPVITLIPDRVVNSGSTVSFTVVATDADIPYGDSLTLSIVEELPTGATFNPVSGLFTWSHCMWSPTHTQPYTFTVHADDGDAIATRTFQITVLAQNMWLPVTLR